MVIEMFEKPLGMRDDFPRIARKKAALRNSGIAIMEASGFELIQTPTLEYYDTIGKISAIGEDALFKLLDNQGNTLVLRPDMTSPIARVAASKLLKEKMPVRLGYSSTVFRAQRREGGRPAEFEQMGVELIGDDSFYADAEIMLLAAELLNRLKIDNIRLVVGHTRLLQLVLEGFGLTSDEIGKLKNALVSKNRVAYEELVNAFTLSDKQQEDLKALTAAASVKEWEKWIDPDHAEQAELYEGMTKLSELIERNGLNDTVTYDLSFSSHMTYYTGLVFEVYGAGSGFPLGNGGRYDGLMKQFGLQVGATGFGFRADRLLEVMPEQEERKLQTLVLFTEQTEEQAHAKARSLRQRGQNVTLQYAPAVAAIEEFRTLFDEIYDVK